MNVRTIAATLVVIGGIAAGTATAQATPSQGNGHTPVSVCHREGNSSSHTIVVDNDSVLQAHLRHGDSLGACASDGTPTPTGTPTATVTPTVPAGFDDGDNDPCKNHPFLNAHNQVRIIVPNVWLQDTDCGQYVIEAPRPPIVELIPAPWVIPTTPPQPEPFGPGIFGHYPQPVFDDFDITQITRLPHAGDGSLSD